MELKAFLEKGIIPFAQEVGEGKSQLSEFFPALMGQCAGAIKDVKTADDIVQEMMRDALDTLRAKSQLIAKL